MIGVEGIQVRPREQLESFSIFLAVVFRLGCDFIGVFMDVLRRDLEGVTAYIAIVIEIYGNGCGFDIPSCRNVEMEFGMHRRLCVAAHAYLDSRFRCA